MIWRNVYFVKPVGHDGPIKIGCSSDMGHRVREMSMWSPIPLEIIAHFPGMPSDEHALHRQFAEYRLHGEWFRPGERLLSLIAALDLPADAFLPSEDEAAA